MEKEDQKESYDVKDIAKYRPIALAPELLEAKDIGGLEATIVTLFEKLGVKNKGDIEAAVQPYMTNPQALQGFVQNFAGRYQESLHSQKLSDLRELYDSAFKKYFKEENLDHVDVVFDSEETYESILNKYNDAQLESKKKNISKEDREKSEKIMKALQRIIIPIQDCEDIELDKLRSPIKEAGRKKRWNALYDEKKEEQEE